jgi:hypothetical protein
MGVEDAEEANLGKMALPPGSIVENFYEHGH